jgi:hypothetical protein
VLLPNAHSFTLVRSRRTVIQKEIQESEVILPPFSASDAGRDVLLPNAHSFTLVRSRRTTIQSSVEESVTAIPSDPSSADAGTPETSGDKNKRNFLKVAGIAGASLVGSMLLPKKADALIMGSSPTTGVVGVKDSTNTRINPATEETAATLLKTSDLSFSAGSLNVNVSSLPGGSSSFSDSGDVAKSALVDAARHVQVDVLTSALPTSASTETTLQTISFGGFKFTIRLDTVGAIDYVGEAAIGTATSAASWRIKRLDNTTGIVLQWAGTGVFNQVWDNRTTLTYT